MLKQLEYATRGHHVAADASRIALLGARVKREHYVDFLVRTYAFEAPIEARWQQLPTLERLLPLAPRTWTSLLGEDLRALRVKLAPVTPASFIGIEQTLGWMFAVERGRRLNGMLHRHLALRLPDQIEMAGGYLIASSSSGLRWDQLGAALDRVAFNHRAAAEQVINAAHRAFKALRLTLPARLPGTRSSWAPLPQPTHAV